MPQTVSAACRLRQCEIATGARRFALVMFRLWLFLCLAVTSELFILSLKLPGLYDHILKA